LGSSRSLFAATLRATASSELEGFASFRAGPGTPGPQASAVTTAAFEADFGAFAACPVLCEFGLEFEFGSGAKRPA
jgi:hypothetical protein